ncbi:hypothetical protein [Gallaecimonas sp. GXIMD4217]|uniref:hypothetical protein n=1 Tax=Gallaecimonas sp. GXIMD4217 TaxID=3131927 RepID=UPI00311B21EA
MSELLRLVNEYRLLWSAPAQAWQQDYPGLYQLSQALAQAPPLNAHGELDAAPFQDELPWLPRLQRLAALPSPRAQSLEQSLPLLLDQGARPLVEWGDSGAGRWLGQERPLITVSPTSPAQLAEHQLWHEADLAGPEALQPLTGNRELLALDLGLGQAQHLLFEGCRRQLPAMVLVPTRFHLIDTSFYEPLAGELPALGAASLKLLSLPPGQAGLNWHKLLVPWLFRPALRKLILDDLLSYARRRGYQAQLQALPPLAGRSAYALLLKLAA